MTLNIFKNNFFKSQNKIGILYGIGVGLIFGIIPIVTILNNTQIFEILRLRPEFVAQNTANSIARGASISAFNDLWTLLLNAIFLLSIKDHFKNWTKVKNLLKTKAGLLAIIGGVWGGPIGNTFFFAVFILLTPSIGSVFFVLEPVFVGLIGLLIFKRSYGKKVWIGISIIVISIVLMLTLQTIAQGGVSINILVGSILGILAIASYSAETLFIDRAISVNKLEGIDPLHFLQIKALSSVFFDFLFIIPLTSGIFSALFQNVDLANSISNVANLSNAQNIIVTPAIGYLAFANLFTLTSFGIAFLGTFLLYLGRISLYKAINLIGATLTNTLFQVQVIVTPIVGGIVFGISLLLGNPFLSSGSSIYLINGANQVWFQPLFWLLAFNVLFFSIYVAKNKTPLNRLRERQIIEENILIKKRSKKRI